MKKFFKILGIISCFVFIAIIVFYFVFASSMKSLDVSNLYNKEAIINANSKIFVYDSNNNEISTTGQNSKVKLDEMPAYVKECFISIEDKDFYKHKGLNYKRIAKALLNNIKSRNIKEGASTISQQLIKNLMLTNEKTLERKYKEMVLTKKLEKEFSKDEILEAYLNSIYFGNNSYGIESASNNYFGKSAKDLTLTESATLAGIIKSPAKYSPISNKENAFSRRNLVLKQMLNDKKISQEEYEKSVSEPIYLYSTNLKNKNQQYYNASIQEVCEILNIDEKTVLKNGYTIFTYLNNQYQDILNNCIDNENYYHTNSSGNQPDSCGIILDSNTGGILGFSGKSNYDLFNMKRSPGSTIKPILVYAPALEKGTISPISQILDEQTDFNGYTPQNVGGKYYGYISVRKAVEKSLNIPAIKVLKNTDIEYCKNFAKSCGITLTDNDSNLAIALGATENGTKISELVGSYIPLANNGIYNKPTFIKKICDKNGKVLYEHKNQDKKVMSEETAYLMTDILKSSVKNGTSRALSNLDFEIAGKTGTVGVKGTNYNTDVYSVAYTPEIVAGVWLGNSTNQKEYNLEGCNNGGTYCSRMLNNIFEDIYKNKERTSFEKPDGIEELLIDSIELENNHIVKLASINVPEKNTIKSLFNKKYAPNIISDNFDDIRKVVLKAKNNNGTITLSFNAKQNYMYEIYRVENNKSKKLQTIVDKIGEISYDDITAEKEKMYVYYLKAIKKEDNPLATLMNYSKNLSKSNTVIIYT